MHDCTDDKMNKNVNASAVTLMTDDSHLKE